MDYFVIFSKLEYFYNITLMCIGTYFKILHYNIVIQLSIEFYSKSFGTNGLFKSTYHSATIILSKN